MNIKNITTRTILLIIIFLLSIGLIDKVSAAESSLYLLPTNITKNIGDIFSASIGLNASNNKICA